MENHVGIDLSLATAGITFREFVHRVQGSVCIYVLFKPHNPYYKFTPFHVTRVDTFGDTIHGMINMSTGDLPLQAVIKYTPHNVIVESGTMSMVVDKLFISPSHLCARSANASSATKRTITHLYGIQY
jgi:hypothetical protein